MKTNYQKGQAMTAIGILFLFISTSVMLGVVTPVMNQVKSTEKQLYSKDSYYASESGIEDVAYRLKGGLPVSGTENLSINGITASTTSYAVGTGMAIVAQGEKNELVRKNSVVLQTGIGAAFNYGVQVGRGGISLFNSSGIDGNLYANGPVTATNSGEVAGDAISAGPTGIIDGLTVTGSAYANTITDSVITGNAYYQTISGSVVNGSSFPGSVDQATTSFPITDAMIQEWKTAAENGGVITSPCSYNIWNQTVTMGPKKINCDLILSGSSVLKLTGPVWVVGDINISNTAEVRVDSSLGAQSAVLIADNPSNRTGKSRIILSNSTKYSGSGHPNSYVMLLSMNTSASTGGSTQAISISNSAQGDLLLYAPYGKISLANSVELREVTAYLIELSNSARVVYETGLQSLLFSTGPGGGYQFNAWSEIE